MREIGYGLYGMAFAHAVRVDADDNVWVVDEGTWSSSSPRRQGVDDYWETAGTANASRPNQAAPMGVPPYRATRKYFPPMDTSPE